MAVTLEIVEQTVHIYTYISPWTWDEFIEVAKAGKAVAYDLQKDPHFPGVIVIGDFTEGSPFPQRMLADYPRVIQFASDVRVKKLISVHPSRYGRALGNLFGKLWGKIEIVDTLHEALHLAGLQSSP